jgi:hypothetical protein
MADYSPGLKRAGNEEGAMLIGDEGEGNVRHSGNRKRVFDRKLKVLVTQMKKAA